MRLITKLKEYLIADISELIARQNEAITGLIDELNNDISSRDTLVLQLQADLTRARAQEDYYRNILLMRLGLLPQEVAEPAKPSEAPKALPHRKGIYQILAEMEIDHRRKAVAKSKEA